MSFRLLPLMGFAITALFCTTAAAWPGPGPDWHGPWWPPGPFGPVIVITPLSPDFYPPPPHPEVAAPQPSVWVENHRLFNTTVRILLDIIRKYHGVRKAG